MIRLARRGKGQALTLAERQLDPGPLLLCDADVRGDLRPLVDSEAELAIAAFSVRTGGGFGLAKRTARALIRIRCGLAPREPLSGQRRLHRAARAAVFPVAMGFGVETRMTIDAVGAGLEIEEVELSARASGDRPRRARVRAPRASAGRSRARVRPSGRQPPRPSAPARRRAGRRRGARRGARSGDRAGRRPLERAGARLSRPPRRGDHDRHAEARRHPALRARPHAIRSPERCSSASPRTPSTSSTRARGGR